MLKDNKKTLKRNYKNRLKDMRIQSGISSKTMAIIFDCNVNHLKNYEYDLCNDIFLTTFYLNTFVLKKDYDMSKRKDKHYIKKFIIDNIPEMTQNHLNNISTIYNVPDSYIKLFYAVTDYIDEYILIILVDYFLMGGNKNAVN